MSARSAAAQDTPTLGAATKSRIFEYENENCLRCHADKKLKPKTERGKKLDLYVTEKEFIGTFHLNVACVDCHQGGQNFREAPHNYGKPLTLGCNGCHEKAVGVYQKSIHGELGTKGDKRAPGCPECHGRHNNFPVTDERSSVNKFVLPETCGKCHRQGGVAEDRKASKVERVKQYEDSIHGRALLVEGLVVAPGCSDCHGAHDILPPERPESRISKKNVPKTCGHCHSRAETVYDQSIHGQMLRKGDNRAPTCVRCHASHEIQQAVSPEFRLGIDNKCGGCHKDRLKRYRETFHGKAIALGRSNVAACSDCHGHHDIYPSANPNSKVNGQNRLQTCRACHPNATRNFAGYLVHADHTDRKGSPIVFWTFVFMTTLLVGTFLFFALHTALWAFRSSVFLFSNFKEFRSMKQSAATDPEQFVRFRPIERFLHLLVMSSFILLVVTGMPLKFYYTDWAKFILSLMQGQAVAAVLHRIGAIITVFYFITHILVVVYSLWRRRARFRDPETGKYVLSRFGAALFGPDSPIPTRQDFRDFVAHQKWFFGKGDRPQFDRWTYWEKFDYLAVFWGVAVIGLSGLIMWFPETSTRILPGWMINVASLVHSDEALLAAAFIFTFHFFNVHFRLEKFPLDTVIFSGRISRTELYHERRRQLERWERENELEDNRVKDEWTAWRKIAIPAGLLAFGLGVLLVVLIYSAMLTRLFHD
jgi:cytochrome b subunit of formate dehydrogenase